MSLRANVELIGLDEVRGQLDPHALRAVLMDALKEGLGPIAAAIGLAAPRGKSGRLSRGMVVRVGDRGGSLVGKIAARAGYGHLVDQGHRMVIGGRLRRAHTLSGRLREAKRPAGRVVGFVPPHPFVAGPFASMQGRLAATVQLRFREFLTGSR